MRDYAPGEQGLLLSAIGAEATSSRTTVHSAYTGDRVTATEDTSEMSEMAEQAVNLGSNLADYTGGTYNRDLADLYRSCKARHATPRGQVA